MKKCLIVDDELPARNELLYILSKIDGVEVVGEASHGVEALELNRELKPDIMFLDIQMPQINGIDVAKKLMQENHKPIIIFVTAYDQFAIEAFDVNAVDYLLKPISEEKLEKRLKNIKIKSKKEASIDYNKIGEIIANLKADTKPRVTVISLNHNNKLIPINIEDILYATIEDKCTIITTKKGRFESSSTLNKLLKRLDSPIFFRSHKSYIVNLNAIESVEPWFNSTYNINLNSDKKVIPVSRSFAKEFKEIMNIDN